MMAALPMEAQVRPEGPEAPDASVGGASAAALAAWARRHGRLPRFGGRGPAEQAPERSIGVSGCEAFRLEQSLVLRIS